MDKYYQLTIEDMFFEEFVHEQPKRIAFIDESGSFGFDFEKEGTSPYYILCAIIVEDDNLEKLGSDFESIKQNIGLQNTELKSSKLNEKRRKWILTQLLPLDFRIVLLIADKKKFLKESPLTEYKQTFIKFLNQLLYSTLYQAYPRLKIIQDETGRPEFQESFKKYVEAHRPKLNLLNQYEFELVNSKNETLVQLADLIAGSIGKTLLHAEEFNYIEMLAGKTTATEFFPRESEPYWGKIKPEECKYDNRVFTLAVKTARDFIDKYENNDAEDRKMQVAVLRFLLTNVLYINPTAYVYSDTLVKHLRQSTGLRVVRNMLFRRVIAPLRDENVILASCNKGYKIPISVDDLMTYLNQSLSTVGPMISRMGRCRDLVKIGTNGKLDLFNDPALIRFKRYFDEKT